MDITYHDWYSLAKQRVIMEKVVAPVVLDVGSWFIRAGKCIHPFKVRRVLNALAFLHPHYVAVGRGLLNSVVCGERLFYERVLNYIFIYIFIFI